MGDIAIKSEILHRRRKKRRPRLRKTFEDVMQLEVVKLSRMLVNSVPYVRRQHNCFVFVVWE